MLDLKKGQSIGDYVFDSVLNQGGMAWVLKVRGKNGRAYCLKMSQTGVSSGQDEFNKHALLSEAEFLSSIQHPRIIRVYPITREFRGRTTREYYAKAVNIDNEPWYYVMEYLDGGTLAEHIKKFAPLTVAETTNIVGNVCLGLYHLYQEKKVAHNDLKPENILFRSQIRKGKLFDPVLVDFGTAAGVKDYREIAGTLSAMSPERVNVARGLKAPELVDQIDPIQAEIWSVGILLYHALTKKLPFGSNHARTLTSQILNDQPTPIHKHCPDVPVELDEFIVNQCLAKKPADRPNILEVMKFLRPYGSGPVRAVNAES